MSSYSWSWSVYVYSRVLVGHFYYIKGVYSDFSAYFGKLVCKCDIDISKGILHAFTHFSCFSFCFHQLAFYKCCIDFSRLVAAFRSDSSNDSVVVYKFFYYLSRQDPFRAVCKIQVCSDFKASLFKYRLYLIVG